MSSKNNNNSSSKKDAKQSSSTEKNQSRLDSSKNPQPFDTDTFWEFMANQTAGETDGKKEQESENTTKK